MFVKITRLEVRLYNEIVINFKISDTNPKFDLTFWFFGKFYLRILKRKSVGELVYELSFRTPIFNLFFESWKTNKNVESFLSLTKILLGGKSCNFSFTYLKSLESEIFIGYNIYCFQMVISQNINYEKFSK